MPKGLSQCIRGSLFFVQSRKCIGEFQQTILGLCVERVKDSTLRGELFCVWMNFKAIIIGNIVNLLKKENRGTL